MRRFSLPNVPLLRGVRFFSFPWESSLPSISNTNWARLGKQIVDTAVSNDTGKIAFDECKVCREQLEVVVQSLGFDMNVYVFGGLVTLGLLEVGGDIDFVGIADLDPNFEESGEIISKVSQELKRLGLRSWALPRARIPVIKVDRSSKSFPGSPFHQLSKDGIFHFSSQMSPPDAESFEKRLLEEYDASQVEWSSSNQYAIAQFKSTSSLLSALCIIKKHNGVEIPIRLPIDPKSGPEIFRFPFDFCLSPTGLRNSYLFSKSLSEYECARHLLIILKKWGRSSGIINSIDGLLASYALTVMLVHYLARINVINKTMPDGVSELQALRRFPDYNPLCRSNHCDLHKVGYLLGGFFEYYGKIFDFSRGVVCTSDFNLTKDTLGWTKKVSDGRPPFFDFAIKDPYGFDNIARNLDIDSSNYVRGAHEKAFEGVLSGLDNPKELLQSLLLNPPKPIRNSKSLSERGVVSETLTSTQLDAQHTLKKFKFHQRKRDIESVGKIVAQNYKNRDAASSLTKNVLGWIKSDRS